MRFRFHIGTLVILVLVLGVGSAALRESNDLWDSGIFTLTLTVLLISILLAVHRTESRRALWLGFALFGWSYLGFSLVPSIEPRLFTTKALAYLDSKVPGRPVVITGQAWSNVSNRIYGPTLIVSAGNQQRQAVTAPPQGYPVTGAYYKRLLGAWRGTTENFIRIGHSLIALLAGWFGGLLSRRLWRASRATDASTPVHVEGTDP
jgi:hypothetical protein